MVTNHSDVTGPADHSSLDSWTPHSLAFFLLCLPAEPSLHPSPVWLTVAIPQNLDLNFSVFPRYVHMLWWLEAHQPNVYLALFLISLISSLRSSQACQGPHLDIYRSVHNAASDFCLSPSTYFSSTATCLLAASFNIGVLLGNSRLYFLTASLFY